MAPNGFNRAAARALVSFAHSSPRTVEEIIKIAENEVAACRNKAENTLADRLIHNRLKKSTIVLLGPALAQRVIYAVSDRYAQKEGGEECRTQTEERMLARYLQFLILQAVNRSSRWVAIGLGQLVYSYSHSEVSAYMKSFVGSTWGDRERKRARAKLLSMLDRRFEAFKIIRESKHSEVRFKGSMRNEQFAPIMIKYLTAFTPWDTKHVIPLGWDPRTGTLPGLQPGPTTGFQYDRLELKRCHAFIDPICFSRLIAAFSFSDPASSFFLPHLLCRDEDLKDTPPERGPMQESDIIDPLCPEDDTSFLKNEARRRKKASIERVIICLDDEEAGTLSPESPLVLFSISTTSNIIQLYGHDDMGRVLLATHILVCSEDGEIVPSESVMKLRRDFRLKLVIQPSMQDQEEGIAAIHLSPSLSFRSSQFSGSSLPGIRTFVRLATTPLYATIFMLVALCMTGIQLLRTAASLEHQRGLLVSLQQQLQHVSNSSNTLHRVQLRPIRTRLGPESEGLQDSQPVDVRVEAKTQMIELHLLQASTSPSGLYTADVEYLENGITLISEARLAPADQQVVLTIPLNVLRESTFYQVRLRPFPGTSRDNADFYVFRLVR